MRFVDVDSREGTREAEVNLTSMIDVIFLLIIFFLLVSELSDLQVAADVKLAEAKTAIENDSPAPDRLVINLTRGGDLIVNGEKTTGLALSSTIELAAEVNRDEAGGVRVDVLVRCDQRVPYERVEQILSTCTRFGVRSVSFKTAAADDREDAS